jgi:hypothetical protein
MTNWTDFVKFFAKANNLTYGCALSDPACSAGYRKKYGNKKSLGKERKTLVPVLLETTAEDINQFVPVQDLAGNLVPVQIKKKRGRPSKKQADENITMEIKEIKKRGRPRKYATAEEARKAKITNTIAGAKRRKGEGILGDLYSGAKKIVKDAVVEKVKKVTAVVYGRQDYPPKVRKILSQYGGKNITGITIGRTPLGTPLMSALQVASGNTFSQKLENTPYDKLFHLFICIELDSSSKIVLEKNEVINAVIGCKLPKDTETKVITSSNIPPALTLNDALEKTRERMGGNYFTYSAKDNNCQDFIVSFLTANNIGNETDNSWVKQETKVLFDGGNNRLRKIANTLTDLGAKVDVLIQGAGIKKSTVNNIGMANKWIEYVKAYAKKNNMKYNEALKDPKMKEGYKKGGTIMTGSGTKDEYISQLYDQANLGANGSVRLN